MAYAIFDIDGTIGAAPAQTQELASSLIAAGHRVGVLTGSSSNPVTQDDWDNKANYLNSLGFGQSYHDMTVISNKVPGGLAAAKAKYLSDSGADIYLDNNADNAQAAAEAGVDLVMVPWASRVATKSGGAAAGHTFQGNQYVDVGGGQGISGDAANNPAVVKYLKAMDRAQKKADKKAGRASMDPGTPGKIQAAENKKPTAASAAAAWKTFVGSAAGMGPNVRAQLAKTVPPAGFKWVDHGTTAGSPDASGWFLEPSSPASQALIDQNGWGM